MLTPLFLDQILFFDHLLELSRQYISNKWSNRGLGQEKDIQEIKI